MAKIYLAGPITGCTWGESEDWRDRVKKAFEDTAPHIQGFSPLREKGFLMNEPTIKDSYGDTIFSSQRAIMSRDFFDVSTSDAVIANFTGSKIVSIGTVMECGWAFQKRIPLIVISEMKDGKPDNIHSHSMLREAANWWVPSEEDAIDIIRTLFTP